MLLRFLGHINLGFACPLSIPKTEKIVSFAGLKEA